MDRKGGGGRGLAEVSKNIVKNNNWLVLVLKMFPCQFAVFRAKKALVSIYNVPHS